MLAVLLAVLVGKLELEAKHKTKLPRQTRDRVGRCGIVVVVVEVIGRSDLAEIALGTQRLDGLECIRPGLNCRRIIVQGKIVGARGSELNMIEDVKCLHTAPGARTYGS